MDDCNDILNGSQSRTPEGLLHAGMAIIEGKNGVYKNYQYGMFKVQMAADSGSSKAKFYLGVLYNEGKVVSKDPNKGLQWIQAAAEEELAEAQRWLADYHSDSGNHSTSLVWRNRAAINGDRHAQAQLANDLMGVTEFEGLHINVSQEHFQIGMYWLQESAKQNHVGSLLNLGVLLYKTGQLNSAYNYYFLAAALMDETGLDYSEGGGARPHYNLGLLCEETGDLKQAYSWFYFANNLSHCPTRRHAVIAQERVKSKLSEVEVIEAQNEAVTLAYQLEEKRGALLKDWRKLDELIELANGGDADAAFDVSERFRLFPKLSEQRQFLEKAAHYGSVKAMVLLGSNINWLKEGLREEERDAEKIRWLKAAANNGEPEAMYELSDILRRRYEDGRLVELIDYGKISEQSFFWLNKASDRGHRGAQVALGIHILEKNEASDNNAPKEIKAALDLIRRAAEAEEGYAQLWLGEASHEGKWVQKNDPDALVWLIKAARNGFSQDACYSIGMIYLYGKDVECDSVEGVAWLKQATHRQKDRGEYDAAVTKLSEDQKKAALRRSEEIRAGFYSIKT